MTKEEKAGRGRWYDDACGTALAMELVGERWSMLIVRELMFGGRRFSELKTALTGISANILTQRLEGLEASGVLVRRKLPPPASVQIYELTEWGYESEEPIKALGRWAVRSPLHDPTLPLSAASIMMSFRTMLSAERAAGLDATIGFRMGAEQFLAHVADGEIPIRRADPDGAGIVFETDPMTLASIVYGGRPLADAEAAGALRLIGDRALAERFVTLFVLPEKFAA
ncbi:winged helix-turn-helix transcriptional regulator [Sphingomonas sp. HF-S3]|uniref:Winged helix-turn-helix transcriptional regulator n=1 Tax=Sphingomonas rustica TaxID=3103142 RepID=A0ABV0BD99_9SPHN